MEIVFWKFRKKNLKIFLKIRNWAKFNSFSFQNNFKKFFYRFFQNKKTVKPIFEKFLRVKNFFLSFWKIMRKFFSNYQRLIWVLWVCKFLRNVLFSLVLARILNFRIFKLFFKIELLSCFQYFFLNKIIKMNSRPAAVFKKML